MMSKGSVRRTKERDENANRMMIDDDFSCCVYSCPTVGEAAAY